MQYKNATDYENWLFVDQVIAKITRWRLFSETWHADCRFSPL